jgi:hypothetical protein
MNAVTAILLSVLVHLGGVELDTTRGASLQWFRDSELTGQWELEAVRAGAYRFVSEDGLVVLERLREANMIYSVHQYETMDPSSGDAIGPIPRALLSLGTVSLQQQAQNLRTPSSGNRLAVDPSRVPVAWHRVASSTGTAGDESEGDHEETGDSPVVGEADRDATSSDEMGSPSSPTPSGSLAVIVTPGQWSASHAESGQVMVLRVR